jgi:hypothetical protein
MGDERDSGHLEFSDLQKESRKESQQKYYTHKAIIKVKEMPEFKELRRA